MRHDADVRGYAVTHPPGRARLPGTPGWNRLVHSAAGVLTVHLADSAWTVPPRRVLWVPDGAEVTVANRGRVAVRTLYLSVERVPLRGVAEPGRPRVVQAEGLVRELLLHAVAVAPLYLERPVDDALVTLLLDRLGALPEAPLALPMPTDPLCRAVAAAILDDPAVPVTERVRAAAVSRRTLERAFVAGTGMPVGAWRRRARILRSIEELEAGASVTRASSVAGYATPSAYVEAFRQELGRSPGRFLGG